MADVVRVNMDENRSAGPSQPSEQYRSRESKQGETEHKAASEWSASRLGGEGSMIPPEWKAGEVDVNKSWTQPPPEQLNRRPTESLGNQDELSSVSMGGDTPRSVRTETQSSIMAESPTLSSVMGEQTLKPMQTVHVEEPSPSQLPPSLQALWDKTNETVKAAIPAGRELMEQNEKVATFMFIAGPALITALFGYYRNGGPTWFSLHPIMNMTSIVTVCGSLLAHHLGNKQQQMWLSIASSIALTFAFYVVYSAKEMYAKPHLLTMHSHFGGMVMGLMYTYSLICLGMNYWERLPPAMQEWRRYITPKTAEYACKATAWMGLTTAMVGIMELERSFFLMMIWIASLGMFYPFLTTK